ncbi:hydroxymethylbilane synthase [Natronospora cellulosivora (SeqCode)]
MRKIVVGTRGSKLAVAQSKLFIKEIEKINAELEIRIKMIKTKGDKILDKPLREIGGKNIFIKEIEQALLDGEVDIAIHSLKDMPAKLAEDFVLACYPEREDPRDILISREDYSIDNLAAGSILGSGSLRRQVQIKNNWPGLEFENIRGNVDTRIKKMRDKGLDGIVLAAAGLHRLNLNNLITSYLSPNNCVPPAGQGTLGIEVLRENHDLRKLLSELDHLPTRLASHAERAYLTAMGGDCHFPIGVYGQILDDQLKLLGFLASADGESYLSIERYFDIEIEGYLENSLSISQLELKSEEAGKELAEELLSNGGSEILEDLKGNDKND